MTLNDKEVKKAAEMLVQENNYDDSYDQIEYICKGNGKKDDSNGNDIKIN